MLVGFGVAGSLKGLSGLGVGKLLKGLSGVGVSEPLNGLMGLGVGEFLKGLSGIGVGEPWNGLSGVGVGEPLKGLSGLGVGEFLNGSIGLGVGEPLKALVWLSVAGVWPKGTTAAGLGVIGLSKVLTGLGVSGCPRSNLDKTCRMAWKRFLESIAGFFVVTLLLSDSNLLGTTLFLDVTLTPLDVDGTPSFTGIPPELKALEVKGSKVTSRCTRAPCLGASVTIIRDPDFLMIGGGWVDFFSPTALRADNNGMGRLEMSFRTTEGGGLYSRDSAEMDR